MSTEFLKLVAKTTIISLIITLGKSFYFIISDNSEMRINVEYQYTDRNFTRFITYGGISHERENWQIGGYFYSESDVKNQPLQQNLSREQIDILQNAGDDISQNERTFCLFRYVF